MKKIYSIIFLSIVLCGVLALVGCGGRPLAKPGNLKINESTLELRWSAVPDASYYTLSITGDTIPDGQEQRNVSKNTYSLESLQEGNYVISVKAISSSEERKDSAWSEKITFIREHETGLRFNLINSNTEYEVSGMGSAPSDVVVPDIYRGKPVTRIGAQAFRNRALTSIVLGHNIVSIGEQAFNNCSYLESITIPDSVTEIGERAFQSCRTLESVVIPDSVTLLGEKAFQFCIGVTNISIGKGITEIPADAFSGCRKLEDVVIPDAVLSIGNDAFSECSALQSATIGKNVMIIGDYAFYRNVSLTQIVYLGNRIEEIGEAAFSECSSLTNVTIPDSVHTIGKKAFAGCQDLVEIKLGKNLITIGEKAFNETAYQNDSENQEDDLVYLDGWVIAVKNTKKESYTVKEGTVGIAAMSFRNCDDFSMIELPNSVEIIDDYAFMGCDNLYSVIIGSGVQRIGVQAFYKCEKLKYVFLGSYDYETGNIIESSLTTIDSYAFMGCISLTEIVIPNTVTTIGSYAFRESGIWIRAMGGVVYAGNWLVDCDDNRVAKTVTVRQGTVGIANYAFYNCSSLRSVVIVDSVKTIGRAAFYNCDGLVEVQLPNGLEVIEDYTFYRCSQLETVNIPNGVQKIGRSAFYECLVLCSKILGGGYMDEPYEIENGVLVIPDSVIEIGDYAFYGCGKQQSASGWLTASAPLRGFQEVIIGQGVKSIGYNAFNGSEVLKRVVIGDGVETIGARAFYKCENLQEVVFGNGIKIIGERAFYQCSSLESITIPNGVTEIYDYTFYRCSALAKLNLGKVSRVGNYAFFGCVSLENVMLSQSVHEIGKQAFRNCSNLTSVLLGKNIEVIDMHAFYGCNQLTIYTELVSEGVNWNSRWNTSYRPVLWNCTLSSDGSYVESYTTGTAYISNAIVAEDNENLYSASYREGYTFVGWSTTKDGTQAEYTAEDIGTAPEGITLYAIWQEGVLPEESNNQSEL